MLGGFKLRMLAVIVIAAMVGLIMQSGNSSKKMVEPVLKYIMQTNYDVGRLVANYIPWPGKAGSSDALPVEALTVLKTPCDFLGIERNFGWHWSGAENKQEFCPGIYLKVKENTLVNPILGGEVQQIKIGPDQDGTVLIRHNSKLVSVYGGLKEILVKPNAKISADDAIGRTGSSFYFEVRNEDSPVNPINIFK